MRFYDECYRRLKNGKEDRNAMQRAAEKFGPLPNEDLGLAQLSAATVISADNVCEFFYALSDQEDWVFPKDFPNVAPPFDNFFIECRHPTKVNSKEHGVRTWDGADRWGFHCTVMDVTKMVDELSSKWKASVREKVEHIPIVLDGPSKQEVIEGTDSYGAVLLNNTKWVVNVLSYVCFDEAPDAHIHTAGSCNMFVGKDGKAIQFHMNYPGEAWVWQGVDEHTEFLNSILKNLQYTVKPGVTLDRKVVEEPNHSRELFRLLFQPCLLAICFMHCKNVVMVDEHPPRQQRRAAERAGVRPPTVYKTLQIAPLEQIMKRGPAAKGPSSGIQLRMHIRRGTFRDYRQGKGLFGKWHGLYWWEPRIIAGDSKTGVVEKDYKVVTPNDL